MGDLKLEYAAGGVIWSTPLAIYIVPVLQFSRVFLILLHKAYNSAISKVVQRISPNFEKVRIQHVALLVHAAF